MFKVQNWKIGLVYAMFGTIIGLLLSPVTAQRDKFDTIQCSRLEVIDNAGITRVALTTNEHDGIFFDDDDANIIVFNKAGKAGMRIGVDSYGGYVFVIGNDNDMASGVSLINNARGGLVQVVGKDDNSQVALGIEKHGGAVGVVGKDNSSRVALGVEEHGGYVIAYGKDEERKAALSINKSGGIVFARGKGEGKTAMGINIFGNGAVSTVDKNGTENILD